MVRWCAREGKLWGLWTQLGLESVFVRLKACWETVNSHFPRLPIFSRQQVDVFKSFQYCVLGWACDQDVWPVVLWGLWGGSL